MTFFLEIWYAAYDTYTQAYLCSQNLYAQIFHPGYWVLRLSFALTCSVSITFLLLWCPTISCYCPFFNLLVYYLHLVFFWCPLFPFPVLWVVCFSTTQHNYIFFHFYFFLHYHFLCSTVLCMFSLRTPLLFTCVILLSSPPSTLTQLFPSCLLLCSPSLFKNWHFNQRYLKPTHYFELKISITLRDDSVHVNNIHYR